MAPASPYHLMQERYQDDPWALLVGTILFNMVHGSKARPVLERFLRRWPDPESVKSEDDMSYWTVKKMANMFRPLGFQNRRADRIWRMTHDFIRLRPDTNHDVDIRDLHGIGKYGADSFDMFYRGYLVKDAEDKELQKYVLWYESLPEGAHKSLRPAPRPPGSPGKKRQKRKFPGAGEGSQEKKEV